MVMIYDVPFNFCFLLSRQNNITNETVIRLVRRGLLALLNWRPTSNALHGSARFHHEKGEGENWGEDRRGASKRAVPFSILRVLKHPSKISLLKFCSNTLHCTITATAAYSAQDHLLH